MAPASWWRDGVLYQIYPRSFGDANGDGIGDLRGITARLDHLEWLGVDGIWLNPTFPSPNDDWGYDVSDYTAVHPDLGTLEDLDELIAEAGRRGIRVLLDLVPNHTSDRHAWFQDALDGPRRAPPRLLRLGRPGRRRRPAEQLALELRRLRLDAARADGPVLPQPVPAHPARPQLVERGAARGDRRRAARSGSTAAWRASGSTSATRSSRTASCATTRCPAPGDHPHVVKRGLKQVYSMNRPELHDVLRRWRALTARARGRAGAGGGDLRARPRAADPVLRARRGRAAPRVQLPVLPLRPRPGADAPDRRGHGGDAARGRVAGVDGLQPRRQAARDPLGGRGPGAHARGADDPARPARDAVPLLRRRDRAARHAAGPRRRARPGRGAARRSRGEPRRLPHADAVEPTSPAAASRRTARRRGCRSATSRPTTSPPSARTPARSCTSCAT